MKRLIAGALALALPCGAACADPVHGNWKTQPGDRGAYAHVRIASCGDKVCGTLSRTFDRAGRQIPSDKVGTRMVWDMTPGGNGSYSGGKILDPQKGKTYRSKMQLSGNSLKVSGCIGPICRGQTWTRVE